MIQWSACPRCDNNQIKKIADSPKKGVWEVYRCTYCNYVWRTTENLDNIHKYDEELGKRAQRPFREIK